AGLLAIVVRKTVGKSESVARSSALLSTGHVTQIGLRNRLGLRFVAVRGPRRRRRRRRRQRPRSRQRQRQRQRPRGCGGGGARPPPRRPAPWCPRGGRGSGARGGAGGRGGCVGGGGEEGGRGGARRGPRHCNWGRRRARPLGQVPWEGLAGGRSRSQETYF